MGFLRKQLELPVQAIGFGLVVLGFLLMSGGKTEDPNIFNGEEVFSFRRITFAPFTVLLGFITDIYSIFMDIFFIFFVIDTYIWGTL